MPNTFQENFWDQDFLSSSGYEVLTSRLKDGKKFLDIFVDFLKNRVKFEDEYGKKLASLSQSMVCLEEIGTLRNAWDSIRKETEGVGKVHCDIAKKLNNLIDRSLSFRTEQQNGRRSIDEKMQKVLKDKKITYDNLKKAKRTYEQRCKETDQCKDAYDSKPMYTPKEEDRLKKNLAKAKTVLESADASYQSSVKTLEDCRKKWVLEMEDTCSRFQGFEEERIQFLRNEMWIYTNLGSLQAIEIDGRYEDCRKVIEKCNENADIETFINKKRTGSERPAPMLYENYHHSKLSASVCNPSPRNQSTILPSQLIAQHSKVSKSLERIQPYHGIPSTADDDDDDAYSTVKDLDVHDQLSQHQHYERRPHERNEPMVPNSIPEYAAVMKNRPRQKYVRVSYDYDAQGAQELSIRKGDILEVLRLEDNEWALGSLNGAVGAFPREFVEDIE